MGENRYIVTLNGVKMVVENVRVNNSLMMVYENYEKKKSDLLEAENYEELIELEKLKHFDFSECIKFWDNFNLELYLKVLKAKNR